MIEFSEAQNLVQHGLDKNELIILVGNCKAEYKGRASSKLDLGTRLIVIKGDKSIALHQNKKVRPMNYMMNATIWCNNTGETFELMATTKKSPREELKVIFEDITFAQSFLLDHTSDLRLVGSEEQISAKLIQDLSFIEIGLKPSKQEVPFSKGVIDILAEDAKGRLVIIEVKRRKATLDAVSQMHRYHEQLKNIKGKQVRAMLLAPEITENARKLIHHYGFEYKRLDFEIKEHQATIKGFDSKQTKLFQFK